MNVTFYLNSVNYGLLIILLHWSPCITRNQYMIILTFSICKYPSILESQMQKMIIVDDCKI